MIGIFAQAASIPLTIFTESLNKNIDRNNVQNVAIVQESNTKLSSVQHRTPTKARVGQVPWKS
jgi:hypothetical protein